MKKFSKKFFLEMNRTDFNKKKKYIDWKYGKEGNPLTTLILTHQKFSNWYWISLNANITITDILK
jgi:hypothetical protein